MGERCAVTNRKDNEVPPSDENERSVILEEPLELRRLHCDHARAELCLGGSVRLMAPGKARARDRRVMRRSAGLPSVLVFTLGGVTLGGDGVVEEFVFGRSAVAEGGVSPLAVVEHIDVVEDGIELYRLRATAVDTSRLTTGKPVEFPTSSTLRPEVATRGQHKLSELGRPFWIGKKRR